MFSFFFQHSFIIYVCAYDFLVLIFSHIHPTSPLHHIPSWLCHAHNYIACTYMHARTHCPITRSTCSEQLFRSHKSWDDEIFHFYSPLLCTIPLTQPLPSHIAINCTSYIAVKGAVRGSAHFDCYQSVKYLPSTPCPNKLPQDALIYHLPALKLFGTLVFECQILETDIVHLCIDFHFVYH